MNTTQSAFSKEHVLHELKHYLPAQAPLKDFIHHNTLHAFQSLPFEKAMHAASNIFGFNTRLSLEEFRALYQNNVISDDILKRVIRERKGTSNVDSWMLKLLQNHYTDLVTPKVGQFRSIWKNHYKIDLDNAVFPLLFRLLCSYLDQGISLSTIPNTAQGFLATIQELEKNSAHSLFRTSRAKQLLQSPDTTMESLLDIIVGDERFYESYIFDQQFSHSGWSGLVATIEAQPETLLDYKAITLSDLILVELLFELDTLDYILGENWKPLADFATAPINLFEEQPYSELQEVLTIWQEAYEWSYYDCVLAGIKLNQHKETVVEDPQLQAVFCIDDRECSIRRHIENIDKKSETFGTPGFFGVEFYYKPENGKFITKLCPAPVTPKYLIKEIDSTHKHATDLHLTKHSHSLLSGWLFSQTLGFWSAIRLFFNILKPSMSPATATSLKHMDQFSKLSIENQNETEDGLQIGFTIDEMVDRSEGLLKSIGLVKNFAPIVYIIGHGSSSVNNPHYAAYDCGACSGRPGSVNSRVASYMANHVGVRKQLSLRGIYIPETTRFVAGLHDTTRDEMVFYDEEALSETQQSLHKKNKQTFAKALDNNAKERSRRFDVVNTKMSPKKVHERVKVRSVSLFEPRPELNHATNTLCIVGKRTLTRNLFLDRRAFMNSYDYDIDPQGKFLFNILKAAAPVCGGINLEYYFSRVDNQKLGAGTKLPHNVMGLIGVANGIDGDLRPGLPSQMIEVHDPLRLLIIVEHYPDVVLNVIQQHAETYEWFKNEWVHLVVCDPKDYSFHQFKNGAFIPYETICHEIQSSGNMLDLIESTSENIPITHIQEA